MTFSPQFTHLEKRLKRHVIGPVHVFRTFTHIGFESILATELSRIGLNNHKSFPGGLQVETKMVEAWKILAYSRTLRRLDMEIGSFHVENFGKLEKELEKIPWELFYPTDSRPQIKVKTKKSRLYHSDAIKERLENIWLRQNTFSTTTSSVQRLRIEIENDICKLYVDIGGNELYKRGYEKFVEAAPLQDSLAAAILLAGGITNSAGLLDPMCGSGTFSLEAAAIAKAKHPALTRNFACEFQPAFREDSWNYIKENSPKTSLSPNFSITTSDIDKKSVFTTTRNAISFGVNDIIHPEEKDFFDGIIPHSKGSLLVLNPPYGIRLQANINRLYCEIGKKIRSDYRDCKIALLCKDHSALHAFSPGVVSAVRTNHGGLNIFIVFAEARKL